MHLQFNKHKQTNNGLNSALDQMDGTKQILPRNPDEMKKVLCKDTGIPEERIIVQVRECLSLLTGLLKQSVVLYLNYLKDV